MNGQPELKRDDVEALAGEMRDLKEALREISGKLGRIEKRLRAFFPTSFPESKGRREKPLDLRENPPTMTPQQVLDFYSELVSLARSGQEREVEARAAKLGISDLALLVRELGAPLGKKPNRTALTKSLIGRLKESVLLSRHTNRPPTEPYTADETRESRNDETSGPPVDSDDDASSE